MTRDWASVAVMTPRGRAERLQMAVALNCFQMHFCHSALLPLPNPSPPFVQATGFGKGHFTTQGPCSRLADTTPPREGSEGASQGHKPALLTHDIRARVCVVWGVWHKASVLGCLPLAAPIGLSPLHILTLCGSERVSVVSMEPRLFD